MVIGAGMQPPLTPRQARQGILRPIDRRRIDDGTAGSAAAGPEGLFMTVFLAMLPPCACRS